MDEEENGLKRNENNTLPSGRKRRGEERRGEERRGKNEKGKTKYDLPNCSLRRAQPSLTPRPKS